MSLVGLVAKPLSPATQVLDEHVRARREALHLSQEALTHQTGIHWTFLDRSSGDGSTSAINLLKLAAELGIDPAELVQELRSPDNESQA